MKKLGIYVQVPFCQTKCTYCNFHTGVVAKDRFAPYVEAVCKEIREHPGLLNAAGVRLSEAAGEKEYSPFQGNQEWLCSSMNTVYFGGGTPSLLEPGHLGKTLDTIREVFGAELEEVTLEADPETVEEGKAAAWVA